jgi:hypothetical protein
VLSPHLAAAQALSDVSPDALLRPDLLRQVGCAVRSGQVTQIVALAHTRLHISRAQDHDWDHMAREIKEAVQPLAAECTRPPDPPPRNWSEQLAQLQRLGDVLSRAARAEGAANAMYAKLTRDQQHIVDEAMRQAERNVPGLGGTRQ